MFGTYLELGFDHISDLKAYDHILFIVALCVAYSISQWKQLLILVTAFTVGHSITLAMASLQLIRIPALYIEVLIPVTIAITAIQNMVSKPAAHSPWRSKYLLPLFFGFIHGMGFSNFFRSLLGQEAEIVIPLLAFNLGVEFGQIGIVAVFLLISAIVTMLLKINHRIWTMAISALAIVLSLQMIYARLMEI
jgi:hypothetical protein